MIEFDFTAVAPFPDSATRFADLSERCYEMLHCYGRGHLQNFPQQGDEIAGVLDRSDLSAAEAEVTFIRHGMGWDLPRIFLTVGTFDSEAEALGGLVRFARVARSYGWAINDLGGTAQEILPDDGDAAWLSRIFEHAV